MNEILILTAVVIVICIVLNKISNRLGIPMLLGFIVLGMVFGSDGILKIQFDNFAFADYICSTALIFIMFYGGFGTNWSEAKPIAVKAVGLSTLGVVLTAGFVGLFCHYVLKISFLESMLIGLLLASTDAASVFSILRSKRLNLKYNTASILEIESGSNDPAAYMLTVIVMTLIKGQASGGQIAYMLFSQIVYGIGIGLIIAFISSQILKRFKFTTSGFDTIFVVAVAVFSYALPTYVGGNGYLSAYIVGIILGNSKIRNKKTLVPFFDGINGLMQMLIFFLLGLLSYPSKMLDVCGIAILIAIFLTFVARPLAVFAIMTPFRSKISQQLLVAWSGLRGAASIVFSVMAIMNVKAENDIFHIVFFIVLFSILLQGSLLPVVAKKLNMIDDSGDVMKTFTDYSDEVPIQFIKFTLDGKHGWVGKNLTDIILPPDTIVVLIIRGENQIVPDGKTMLEKGDTLVLCAKSSGNIEGVHLSEKRVSGSDKYVGKTLSEIHKDDLIIMIRRGDRVVIPQGKTIVRENDVLVINHKE